MVSYPDLLHAAPRLHDADGELLQGLTFAFTTGGPQSAFDRLRVGAGVIDAAFRPECFAGQLFLKDLVERCLPLPKDTPRVASRPARAGVVAGLLARPPADQESLTLRQGIARELSGSAKARASAVRALCRIAEWRALIEAPAGAPRFDLLRRRIEILYATKALFDEMAGAFEESASGLRRISDWAAGVQASPPFATLGRLLADEAHLATVGVELRLGRDGELRRYDIVRVEGAPDNPFRASPWQRFWSQFLILVFGHRVRREEVASRLVDSVFEGLVPELPKLFELQQDLDFHLGGLALREIATARGLAVSLAEFHGDGSTARCIRGLWNPFLLGAERAPVPCDVDLGAESSLVIVTGPNSGGKTRFIEALALTQLLAHAGLWVPAASAVLPWSRGLFAALHQPHDLLHREGNLGTELLRIKDIFERLDVGGLVVVDELCSGTNPSEGEEIFEVVVDLLGAMRAQAFITTHFLHFAGRLQAERRVPGLAFLQVELDGAERPTFRFVPGVAVTSLARKTAERLGVTREELGALVTEKIRSAPSNGPPTPRPSRGPEALRRPPT